MDNHEVFPYKQLMHLEATYQIISDESKSALYEEGRKDTLGKVGEKIGKREKKQEKKEVKKSKKIDGYQIFSDITNVIDSTDHSLPFQNL